MRITSWTRLLRELLGPARAQQRAASTTDPPPGPARRRDSVDYDGGLFVIRMEERRVLNAAPAVTGSEPVAAPIEVPAPTTPGTDAGTPQIEPSHQDIRELSHVHADALGSAPQDIAD